MRAVIVFVDQVAGVVHGIDSVDVVNVAVAVVVDVVGFPAPARFAGIGPQVGSEVLVGDARAGVGEGHDDVRRHVLEVPGLGRVNVRVGRAQVLSGVVQVPLEAVEEVRVVRRGCRLPHAVVEIGRFDVSAPAVAFDERLRVRAFGQFQDVNVSEAGELVVNLHPLEGVNAVEFGFMPGLGNDEDSVGAVGHRRWRCWRLWRQYGKRGEGAQNEPLKLKSEIRSPKSERNP